MRVAFIHPDLGIGGAEQLVVNLALCCKNLGWYVKFYTPSYDPKRAFDQTKDGTLEVEVRGNCFPRLIFGKCHAFCEYMRVLFCALYLLFFGGQYDVVVLDQIPFPIPFLNIRFKTFFYCHHPDKLLCVDRRGVLKKIYRYFIDTIEEITMAFAHVIVVNSNYTRSVFLDNFHIINKFRKLNPKIIYPCIDLKTYDRPIKTEKKDLLKIKGLEKLNSVDLTQMKVIVSLNRYEEKKNLDLAVLSYISYIDTYAKNDINKSCLIIAGGYDESLRENIEVYAKLNEYIKDRDLNILFLRNIQNEERSILFRVANVVLYTPKNEHFGIVPIEAMYCGAWVIAHKSGGPMESVVDNKTGDLLDNEEPGKWGLKLKELIDNKNNFNIADSMNSDQLKSILKEHVENTFSITRMQKDFYNDVISMFPNKKSKDN